ncbi:hypothetical protein [Actinomycetospora straminea]|uniref:Uncharacterized protein n=1 Tax=Actinomycetospora straminea TaxID=663607 RepID=A0ABP9DWH8_9PSEU|nr:hypothetical protein [Actinomycetospora straminea]MDD7934207.1 hypothetical protein [Actinomycetospora straminea]
MDLRSALLRAAVGCPHALVVPAPGTDRLRARVEQELARRRWPIASAPADADLVVVVGRPGRELAAVVDDIWVGVPAPRTLVRIADEDEVAAALDGVVRRLADADAQRAAASRSGSRARPPDPSPGGRSHGDGGHDELGPGEHDDHSAHTASDGGHHHHGGGMELPGGLAMADLGEDRDGLALDQLHVSLGPVLPEWPSGLVIDVVLQGDVIQEARSRFLDLDEQGATERLPDAARALDTAARVLALAGWEGPAARARGLRDALLSGADTAHVPEELDDLRRRVRRSRLLRWTFRSAGAGRSEILDALDDVLASAGVAVAGTGEEGHVGIDLATLDARLVGAQFAAARLVVAVADPQPRPAPDLPTAPGGAS